MVVNKVVDAPLTSYVDSRDVRWLDHFWLGAVGTSQRRRQRLEKMVGAIRMAHGRGCPAPVLLVGELTPDFFLSV